MRLSGIFSRLRRRPAPAAADDPGPRASGGIDYLRARAGLGPPEAADAVASPVVQPTDPAALDSQPLDATPSAEPLSCEMFIDQAEQAGKAGNWAAAELIWRAIRTHIPQYWPSYTGGADALRQLGRFDEARQLLDQGAALFSWERAFPLDQGRLAMIQGDWSAAETYWRAALTFDIRPWWVYTELAGALEQQGRLEDADAVLHEARLRADEPDEITLFTYPARLAAKRGDWTVAVARWAEARCQFPSVTEIRDRHEEALTRLAEGDPAAYQAASRDAGTTS
jgi:tetratricopeptide (TPR) repeat protein